MAKKAATNTRRKKTSTTRNSTKKKTKVTNKVYREAFSIASIAFCIFLILSLFSNSSGGSIGVLFRSGFVGLFGFGAYILPFIVIALNLYLLFSANNFIMGKKYVFGTLLFLVTITFVHLLSVNKNILYNNVNDYIIQNFTSGSVKNGGVFGAVLGDFFLKIFGNLGAYLFLLTLGLVLVIVLTGRSLLDGIIGMFNSIKDSFSESEEFEEDEEEEEYEVELPIKNKKEKLPPIRKEIEKKEAKQSDKPYTYDIEDKDTSIPKKKILLINEELNFKDKSNPSYKEKIKNEDDIYVEPVIKIPFKDMEKKQVNHEKNSLNDDFKQKVFEEELYKEEDLGPLKDIEDNTLWDEQENEAILQDIHLNTSPAYEDTLSEAALTKNENSFLENSKTDTFFKQDSKAEEPEVVVEKPKREYVFPPIDFLNKNTVTTTSNSRSQILENSKKLEDTLKSFGVEAKVMEVSVGPTVTRYELSPGAGVKVSKISGLSDDLALNLAAAGIRIEAPIPGKAAVGIEVPNKEPQPVFLREVLGDEIFSKYPSKLAFAIGKDIAGNPVVADIAKMPHMLIAGATGSGKSVCINTLIASIIYKAKPEEVKLLMIDPKVVELKIFDGIPHLLIPVVNDPKKAAGALNWAVKEMTNRYDLFAQTSVRDLKGYNKYLQDNGAVELLPQIVIIIDELADLMMTAGKEVEEAICRLAQMARAAGLHLIIATQRPSVDVITGLIKANVPSRISFSVSSGTDSRTILDMTGAEKLLGKGDMLFYPVGMSKPLRVQGGFISTEEVEKIVSYIKQDREYDQSMIDKITTPVSKGADAAENGDDDEFMEPAIEFIVKKEKASASMLQRQFRIGYNRASRIIEILEERGIVGAEDGSKPRRVLMSKSQWEEYNERRT